MFFDLEAFMTPAQRRRQEADRIAHYQRFIKPLAVPWNPNHPIPKRVNPPLVIQGETYKIGYEIFPDVVPTTVFADNRPERFREYGDWRYYHLINEEGTPLDLPVFPNRDTQPKVYFTSDVLIPALWKASPWGWQVWMSITPGEMFSQRSGVKFCRGNVVVGGLGMGWFLHEISKRSQVKRITVVEKSRDLLDWYGNDLCKKYGADVICDDVWNVVGKQPPGTRYALDIWPAWFDAQGDAVLCEARAAGHDIWAWGAARGGAYW